MGRKLSFLVGLFAILFVSYAGAQVPLPGQVNPVSGGGCSASLPWIGAEACEWAGVELIPSVRGGMQWTALNFNLPIAVVPLTGIGPLDLSLKDANVWVGSIRIDARRDSFGAFVSAEGNARKTVTVSTPVEPLFVGDSVFEWTGPELEWWSFNGGIVFLPVYNFGLALGFRYDHLTLGLQDPRDSLGLFPPPLPFVDYRGDILTKLWVPYIGLVVSGPHCRGSISVSPLAWAEVRIPLRIDAVPSAGIADFNDLNYKLNRVGGFVEGDIAYWVDAGSSARFGLWASGTWLSVRGKGTEDFQEAGTLVQANESASDTAMLTRYTLSAGVSAILAF